MDDDDDDDAAWESWGEPEVAPTVDLFSERVFESAAECLAHAKSQGLDLTGLVSTLGLDIYGRVKLVNYVRTRAKSGAAPAEVAQVLQQAAAGEPAGWPWQSDDFLMPVLPEDPLLYSLGAPPASDGSSGATKPVDVTDDPMVGDDDDEPAAGGAGETALLLQTIEHMRSEMAVMLGLNEEEAAGGEAQPKEATKAGGAEGVSSAAAGGDGKGDAQATEGQYGSADGESSAYFNSYAKLSIHEDMLADSVRTLGYRDAIEQNAHLMKDKVVLDVGCGTGILSMIAARAGARHVIAIDASDIVEYARRIIAANQLTDRITVIRGTMESIKLPQDYSKVDVIISEWMGYALLYESMLPSVLFARDKHMAPGGIVLPTACTMCLSLSSSSRLTFWDDVYGFDMSVLKDHAVREATVEVVPAESSLSGPCTFRTVDVTGTDDAALDFTTTFSLTASEEGLFTCFVVHFDTIFDLAARGGVRTSFTTSHLATPTHWKQTSLYLKSPLRVAKGDVVAGTIGFSRGLEYKRGYDIAVSFVPPGSATPITQLWRLE